MIEDAQLLQTEYVPEEVVNRRAEADQLSSVLEPIGRGQPVEAALLYGPSGAGKTCLARSVVSNLQEDVLDIDYQYINCWQHYSRFRVLEAVLNGVGKAADVHRQSTPKDELLERLRQHDGRPYVVVLDEVDQLEDERVLYDLYRIPGLTMILITNSQQDLLLQLDDRLVSRLQASERIHVDGYTLDELIDILRDRADKALREGVVSDEILKRIADTAAGDARVAISTLRNAARRAETEDADVVEHAHVEAVIPDTRDELQEEELDRLSDQQRMIYEIVAEHGEISPGELYDHYEIRADDPKTKRTVRYHLSKLCEHDLVEAEGDNRGRVYRPIE